MNKKSKIYKGFAIKYIGKDGILKDYHCDTLANLHRRFITDKNCFKPDGDDMVKKVFYDGKNIGLYNITYKELLEKLYVGISNIFKYKKRYIRKGIYKIEDVLPFAINPFQPHEGIPRDRSYDGDMIHMDSERYQVFKKSLICSECGIEGSFFAKETTDFISQKPRYHFNLYAIDADGIEVLMTKDHIYPKSKGGSDSLDNYQTMCCKCNFKKGTKII